MDRKSSLRIQELLWEVATISKVSVELFFQECWTRGILPLAEKLDAIETCRFS